MFNLCTYDHRQLFVVEAHTRCDIDKEEVMTKAAIFLYRYLAILNLLFD
jgi:hypothetical protein